MAFRLLLVEDEPGVREMVGEYLRGRGFQLIEVATLARAREVLANTEVDVLLTDLRLADGEGTELIPLVRPLGPAVVVMTAWATPEVAVTLLTAGIADLVLKPFRLHGLYQAVARAVSRRQEARALARDAAAGRWLERLARTGDRDGVEERLRELGELVREHLPGVALRVVHRPPRGPEWPLGGWRAVSPAEDLHFEAWVLALHQALLRVGD